MARMIPARIANDTGSAAEENLFRQFARQLPHDYTVLHSVGWLNRPRGESYHTGEADLVVGENRRLTTLSSLFRGTGRQLLRR